MGERRLVAAAGACFGYIAGGLFKIVLVGLFSETMRRYSYKAQGGLGETANWGEPLFHVVLLTVIPSAWTLGGALIGAATAFGLAHALASGGPWVPSRNHVVAFALTWLALVGASGWFLYRQWRRAGDEVTRYRETTEPRFSVSPAFLEQSQQECDAGSAGSCTLLGQFYHQGQGVPVDLARGLANYRKGCERGGAASCSRVGFMYEMGEVVSADARTALGFYQRACDGGYVEACRSMGALWQRGAPGVPSDLVKTVAAFGKACEGAEGWSCFTVGLMHERGQGTRQDYVRAGELYRKSCDIRYAMGCQYLGDSYAHGEGVARDDARARALYLEAAGLLEKDCTAGDAYSCYVLGTMYRQGQGVTADPRKARDLLHRGCGRGNQDACGALQTLN